MSFIRRRTERWYFGGNYDERVKENYDYIEGLRDSEKYNDITHIGTYGYNTTNSFP